MFTASYLDIYIQRYSHLIKGGESTMVQFESNDPCIHAKWTSLVFTSHFLKGCISGFRSPNEMGVKLLFSEIITLKEYLVITSTIMVWSCLWFISWMYQTKISHPVLIISPVTASFVAPRIWGMRLPYTHLLVDTFKISMNIISKEVGLFYLQ